MTLVLPPLSLSSPLSIHCFCQPQFPIIPKCLPHCLISYLPTRITFLQTTPKRLSLLIPPNLPTSPPPSPENLDSSSTHPNIPTATCPNHLLLPPLPLSTPIAYPAPNHSPYIPNEQQDQNALIPYQGNSTLVPFSCTPLPQSPNSPQFNPPPLSVVPPLQSSCKRAPLLHFPFKYAL
ncbi:hypothetical protein AMTRI_Chr12g271670 [Amborella trichopoda]